GCAVAWLETIGARAAVGVEDEDALARSCFSAATASAGVTGALVGRDGSTFCACPAKDGCALSLPVRALLNACADVPFCVSVVAVMADVALSPSLPAPFAVTGVEVCWCGSMAISALKPASSSSLSSVLLLSALFAVVNVFRASPL